MTSSTPSSATSPASAELVEDGRPLRHPGAADRRRRDRRAGDQRRRRHRPGPRAGRGQGVRAALPAAAGRRRPAHARRRAADGQRAGADGRPVGARRQDRPAAGARRRRARARCVPTMSRMAEVAEDMVARVAADHHRARRGGAPSSSAATTRRWTSCGAPASPSCSPTTGATASRPRSTSPCWAATTSGSPTTRSRSPTGWSSWSPARTRALDACLEPRLEALDRAGRRSAALVGDGRGRGGGGLGVEVLAAGHGRAQVARRGGRPAGCRWGCSGRRCPRR